MRSRLLVAVVAAAFSSLALAQAQRGPPVEMKPSGTPGKATAARAMRITATVYSIDPASRILVLQHDMGGVETLKVGPEVKRLEEFAVGDTVAVEYEQGLALEFQPAGSEWVPPTAVATDAPAGKDQGPGASATSGIKGTVTITAINVGKRLVSIQGPGGNVFRVKAGPRIQLEKLKVGDRLLATYVEAVAIRLEKAKGK
jgi:hypothetical protein